MIKIKTKNLNDEKVLMSIKEKNVNGHEYTTIIMELINKMNKRYDIPKNEIIKYIRKNLEVE